MKTQNFSGKNRTVYCVDPKRLSIGQSFVSLADEGHTSNYENFQLESKENGERIDHLPMECNGMWYFATEDEALEFLRERMGI